MIEFTAHIQFKEIVNNEKIEDANKLKFTLERH